MSSDELSDQQTLELLQKLKDDEAAKRPLVGPVESLQVLQDEYPQDSAFSRKISWLRTQRHFNQIRRLRGDGSCFYRAVTFQLLLTACLSSSTTPLLTALQQAQKDINFADAEIVQDFAEPVYDLLHQRPNADQLEKAFNDPEVSNSAVVFIRLITSSYLRKNADDFLPFLFSYENDVRVLDPQTGLPSMDQFCSNYIEASDAEADHLAIQALSQALGLKLEVAQLDQSFGGGEQQGAEQEVDFVQMEGGEGHFDLGGAVLLLRPGHYDLLLP